MIFRMMGAGLAALALAAMGPAVPPAPLPVPRVDTPVVPAPGAAAPEAARLRILEAAQVTPAEFVAAARPLVLFADTAADPSFASQLALLEARPAALIERDVVVIVDTDPAAASAWRRWLRPEGFSLVLIDKDGQVKQRKPVIWDAREISRAIDKFPSRRAEIGRAGFAQ